MTPAVGTPDDEETAKVERPSLVVHAVLRDVKRGAVYEATAARIRIGRSAECELSIPAAPGDGVSRVHCELGIDAFGSVVLLDAGSTNGTRLNGRPLTGATRVAAQQAVTLGDSGPTLLIEQLRIVAKR
ncbi:FHA domain-containing protein [Gemmatimonas sp.]|jgi:pSer/pThr/pTyr-binding forkhead associated (FHA) protein|uniref:FHA domain-containing protein n=1 Tax=Gemmatimonas sp. TaxID=1962908 RepID=UPI00391F36B4|nr:FHA domain-containing protein [Gemmatimonadota bacterium]